MLLAYISIRNFFIQFFFLDFLCFCTCLRIHLLSSDLCGCYIFLSVLRMNLSIYLVIYYLFICLCPFLSSFVSLFNDNLRLYSSFHSLICFFFVSIFISR